MPKVGERFAEQWKDAVGFEGLYQVSSFGRVKSVARSVPSSSRWGTPCIRRLPEKIMHPTPQDAYGHLLVNLQKGGETHRKWVHHLVLEAFVGPRPTGMECRHFPSNDPTNNRLDNLQWGTPKQNGEDRVAMGTAVGPKLYGEANPFFGKQHTEETKARISAAGQRAWAEGKFNDRRPRSS